MPVSLVDGSPFSHDISSDSPTSRKEKVYFFSFLDTYVFDNLLATYEFYSAEQLSESDWSKFTRSRQAPPSIDKRLPVV